MKRLLLAAAAALLTLSATTAATSPVDRPHDFPRLSTGCFHQPRVPLGQTVVQGLTSGGHERSSLLHLPATYQPYQAIPVITAFHGRKGNGYDIEAFSGLDALNAIVVHPVG